ncbi:MAG: hypothetical protein ACREC5_01465, partial [Thermoplasmata archaeon]
MTRRAEIFEGLAILGTGSFGRLSTPLPGLLFAHGALPSDPPERPILLTAAPAAPPGERRLRLEQEGATLPIALP